MSAFALWKARGDNGRDVTPPSIRRMKANTLLGIDYQTLERLSRMGVLTHVPRRRHHGVTMSLCHCAVGNKDHILLHSGRQGGARLATAVITVITVSLCGCVTVSLDHCVWAWAV